jgi:hypothetical protein
MGRVYRPANGWCVERVFRSAEDFGRRRLQAGNADQDDHHAERERSRGPIPDP